MAAKFSIQKSKSNKYFFELKAANGETVATSEMYESKSNAKRGADAVQRAAAAATIVDDTGE